MQPLRHRLEFLIRKPLERLPDHLERTALVVPHREPIVRQPTLSTPAPPLRRGNCEVQVVRGFDLDPLLPSFSDRVRRLQLLRHEAFVPGDERLLEERLDLLLALRDATGRQQVRRHEPLEELPAHAVRLIDQRSSVEVEDIEQVQLQWNLFLGRFDAVHAPEAAHEILKWKRLALPVHRDDLAFEQKLGRGQCLRNRDDLGKAGRDIAQSPTEDLHRVALAMNLDPRAVELVLDRRHAPCTASTSSRSSAIPASIGFIGARMRKPRERNPSAPSESAISAIIPRSPRNMWAVRTVSRSTPDASAIPSSMTPSFTPIRISPNTFFKSTSRSPSDARPRRDSKNRRRTLVESGPWASAIRANVCETSKMLKDCGTRLACFVLPKAFLSVAHPTFRARASDSAKMRPTIRWTALSVSVGNT